MVIFCLDTIFFSSLSFFPALPHDIQQKIDGGVKDNECV